MDSKNVNLLMNANKSKVWYNGKDLINAIKTTAKLSAEIEEHKFIGDPVTYTTIKGTKIEGSMTVKKINGNIQYEIVDKLQKGENVDATIIVKQERSDGKTERVALNGVNFSEVELFNIEAQSGIEQELPFTATSIEYLDRIID